MAGIVLDMRLKREVLARLTRVRGFHWDLSVVGERADSNLRKGNIPQMSSPLWKVSMAVEERSQLKCLRMLTSIAGSRFWEDIVVLS